MDGVAKRKGFPGGIRFSAAKNAEGAKKNTMTNINLGNFLSGKGCKEGGLKTLCDLCVLCG